MMKKRHSAVADHPQAAGGRVVRNAPDSDIPVLSYAAGQPGKWQHSRKVIGRTLALLGPLILVCAELFRWGRGPWSMVSIFLALLVTESVSFYMELWTVTGNSRHFRPKNRISITFLVWSIIWISVAAIGIYTTLFLGGYLDKGKGRAGSPARVQNVDSPLL